ncbi:hypothetical protein [Priestia megaterium]|uniref:hypothetical protein n=1 Tax=Priestia megaterium TaxID=1404 RepID=UPI001F1359DB|nr:hypothetical protein [Priestia megaterium]UMZ36011.1 hypothetical protein MGJ28_28125 [Priestia megaterium]
MNLLEVISQIVSLVEGINKLSELIEMDKLPPWMFLIGLNLNYYPQKKDKDQEEDKQKKEPS